MKKKIESSKIYLIIFIIIVLAAVIIFIINIYPSEEKKVTIKDEESGYTPTISLEEVKEKMEADDQDFIILDVRNPISYNEKHIAGSINMPLANLMTSKNELPRDKEIIVTCGSEACELSKTGASMLIMLGLSNVKDFRNGVQKWEEAGLPIVGGAKISFSYINIDQVKEKTDIGEDILLLDVRNKEEFAEGHIEGAEHFEFTEVAQGSEELPKDKEIIIYDKTGDRSKLVIEQLARKGFTEIKCMLGGIIQWQEKDYPLVK